MWLLEFLNDLPISPSRLEEHKTDPFMTIWPIHIFEKPVIIFVNCETHQQFNSTRRLYAIFQHGSEDGPTSVRTIPCNNFITRGLSSQVSLIILSQLMAIHSLGSFQVCMLMVERSHIKSLNDFIEDMIKAYIVSYFKVPMMTGDH